MMRLGFTAALIASFAVFSVAAEAGSRSRWSSAEGAHPQSDYYRGGGARVKGYVQRRGGYSYTFKDSINTYGGWYADADRFMDPGADRQTSVGPFDHGFFFDSPARPHGGEAPYMN